MSSLARSCRPIIRGANPRFLHTTSRAQNLSFQPEPQPIPAADALAATAGSPTAVSGEHTSQPSSNVAGGRRLTLAEEQSARDVEEWKVNLRKVREWRRNQGKIREYLLSVNASVEFRDLPFQSLLSTALWRPGDRNRNLDTAIAIGLCFQKAYATSLSSSFVEQTNRKCVAQ